MAMETKEGPQVSVSEAKSVLRATVSTALAKALICGIDECEENNHPLTQLQKIDLAKYSIMNYDQAIEASGSMGFFAALLKG